MNIKITTPDHFELDTVFNHITRSKWVVILAHGMSVNKDAETMFPALESALNARNISTIRFDFRSHGKSSGNPISDFTISGELIDLQTIINFVQAKGFTRIGLVGVSFGGGIVAEYAGRYPKNVQKLCLVSPAIDTSIIIHGKSAWSKKYFADYEEKLALQGFVTAGSSGFKIGPKVIQELLTYTPHISLAHYPHPVLLLQGTNDDTVNTNDILNALQTVHIPQLRIDLIEGGDHAFHEMPYQKIAIEKIIEFFKKD